MNFSAPGTKNGTDFLSTFLHLTRDFESPYNFWKWSAYGAIAATLRFNCYINWGTSKLYPNIYILLLADSAAFRKDAGPELVAELLKECWHTKVIDGRASWQGIVDELSQDIGNKNKGMPIKGGAGVIIATEFTATFVDDPNLIKLMTEGYAYKEEYDYILRGGRTKIKKRCISLLGGSNETLLRDLYSAQATYGGLLRRTCLIRPDKKRPANPLIDKDDEVLTEADKKVLVLGLKELEKIQGEFKLSPDARVAYKTWYTDLYDSYEKYEDKTGFIQGVHSLIAKLCMILAAVEGTLLISEKVLSTAIKEILALKDNYTAYMLASGKNPQAQMGTTILTTLWQQTMNGGAKHALKKRDILLQHWNQISSEDLDKLITTLENAGLILMVPSGSEPAYELTQTAKDKIMSNIQVKSKAN